MPLCRPHLGQNRRRNPRLVRNSLCRRQRPSHLNQKKGGKTRPCLTSAMWWSYNHAFKKPPSFENRGSTGVCLGHDNPRCWRCPCCFQWLTVNLRRFVQPKLGKLGERVGQAWRLHVHPQDSSRAAYVNRKGEVKWNFAGTLKFLQLNNA